MGGRTTRRRVVVGLLAGLAGCTEFEREQDAAEARRDRAPLLTAPTAAATEAPATLRPATAADLVGAWQMLTLPPHVAEEVNTTARFSEAQQYFLIMADGRFGPVLSPSSNVLRLDRAGLEDMFAREPRWDGWTLVDGAVTIAPQVVAGFRPRRADVWRVDTITTGGALLGLLVRPGDVKMDHLTADGTIDYRRVIRRLP